MKRVYNPDVDREDSLAPISPDRDEDQESTAPNNIKLGRTVKLVKIKGNCKGSFQTTMTQFIDASSDGVQGGDLQGRRRSFKGKNPSSYDCRTFAKIRKKCKTKNDHEKIPKGLMNLYSQMRYNLIQTVEKMKKVNVNELNMKFEKVSEFRCDVNHNCQILKRLDVIENRMMKIREDDVENGILKKHIDQLEKKMDIENTILKKHIDKLERQISILTASSVGM